MDIENNATHPYDDEIELIDILKVLWKRRIMIGVLIFMGVMAAFLFVQVKYPKLKTATCQIKLSFPGIDQHKNPDGTLFEKDSIVLPQVIAGAYDNLIKEFGDENKALIHGALQDVEVDEVIPEDIRKKISEAQKKNLEYPYMTTVYALKLEPRGTTPIGDDMMGAVLHGIVGSYKRYFEERYGLEPLVKIEFPDNFVETNEFYDVVNVFQVYSNKLVGFLDEKIKTAGYYKSKSSGYSFVDVKNEIELLQDTHIKPLQAIITNSKMTRDMDASISILDNKIKVLSSLKQKKEMAADVSRKLLEDMRKDTRNGTSRANELKETMPAGISLESGLYGEIRKNDYRSFLLKSIIDAEVEAINSAVDIDYLKKDIEEIKKSKHDDDKISGLVAKMNKVKDYLIRYSKMADEINGEYLSDKIKNSITLVRSPMVEMARAKNIRLILVLALFGSFFVAVFAAFFYEYISNHSNTSGVKRRGSENDPFRIGLSESEKKNKDVMPHPIEG